MLMLTVDTVKFKSAWR